MKWIWDEHTQKKSTVDQTVLFGKRGGDGDEFIFWFHSAHRDLKISCQKVGRKRMHLVFLQKLLDRYTYTCEEIVAAFLTVQPLGIFDGLLQEKGFKWMKIGAIVEESNECEKRTEVSSIFQFLNKNLF